MAKKKYRVRTKVTKDIPIDVEADDAEAAKQLAKQKAEKEDYGPFAPPLQVPHVEVVRVDELHDDLDHEERG